MIPPSAAEGAPAMTAARTLPQQQSPPLRKVELGLLPFVLFSSFSLDPSLHFHVGVFESGMASLTVQFLKNGTRPLIRVL